MNTYFSYTFPNNSVNEFAAFFAAVQLKWKALFFLLTDIFPLFKLSVFRKLPGYVHKFEFHQGSLILARRTGL
jgi:hypothetical protein